MSSEDEKSNCISIIQTELLLPHLLPSSCSFSEAYLINGLLEVSWLIEGNLRAFCFKLSKMTMFAKIQRRCSAKGD
jgi:hypothetical protein